MADNSMFDVAPEVSGVTLERLSEIGQEALNLIAYIGQLEEALKEARTALHELRTKDLPTMMLDAQTDNITVAGTSIYLRREITGSFPKDDAARKKAVKYLEKIGQDNLIKTTLTATFGRTEFKKAQKVAKQIAGDCDPVIMESVHHQTLTSFARKRLKEGKGIKLGVLGLSTFDMVAFKDAKK